MTSTEADLYNPAKDFASPACMVGTVGWEGREDHAELGTEDNDGFTLVCVTLYEGKTPGEPTKRGVAQGHQIRCHINSLMGARVPPRGTRVYVLFPHGMTQVPGAGVIVATIEKTATKDQLDKDRAVLDFGPDTHVVIKGKSVSLQDHDSPADFIGVGTPRGGGDRGIYMLTHDGAGFTAQGKTVGAFSVDADGASMGLMQLTDSEATFAFKGLGSLKFKAGECMLFAAEALPVKAPMVLLGPAAAPGTAALYMLLGAPAPSLSVFVSP